MLNFLKFINYLLVNRQFILDALDRIMSNGYTQIGPKDDGKQPAEESEEVSAGNYEHEIPNSDREADDNEEEHEEEEKHPGVGLLALDPQQRLPWKVFERVNQNEEHQNAADWQQVVEEWIVFQIAFDEQGFALQVLVGQDWLQFGRSLGWVLEEHVGVKVSTLRNQDHCGIRMVLMKNKV